MAAPDPIRRLLASCDESQRAAITSTAKPLLVVASAGSGKTRVLTRRIAWLVLTEAIAPNHVMALTFTRKAATELRDRLGPLGLPEKVMAGTFHAIALAQLRRRAIDTGRPLPVVLESKSRLLGAVVTDRPHQNSDSKRRMDRREVISTIAAEIEWAKARGITPDTYVKQVTLNDRNVVLDTSFIADAFTGYEQEKRSRRVLDFDDLLSELTTAMANDPDFAATQRWRYRHLFVDEFQDASPTQLGLLKAWLGDRPDLFAVGDPRQAIYGWNGADRTAVTHFAEQFKDATVLHLDVNYRSTPQVIAVASSALPRNERRPADAPRPDGNVPSITAYVDDAAEAAGIAADIRRRRAPGQRWSDCAVLARSNAQLRLFEEALRAAGIPSRVGDARSFYAVPDVRSALNRLDRCRDASSFARWLNDLNDAVHEDDDALDDEESTSTSTKSHSNELEQLLRLSREYAELDSVATGDGCSTFIRETLRSDPLTHKRDAVDLITFHRAKGLEWPLVWVAGLEDGLVPIGFAKTNEAIDEERRLLYVALSRAEDELHCSWAKARRFGTRTSTRQPSPWLVSIENACQSLRRNTQPRPDVAKDALAKSRAALARNREE